MVICKTTSTRVMTQYAPQRERNGRIQVNNCGIEILVTEFALHTWVQPGTSSLVSTSVTMTATESLSMTRFCCFFPSLVALRLDCRCSIGSFEAKLDLMRLSAMDMKISHDS